jgi:tripartite-type tricarboxylate transporter receptor subunit TctC
MMKARPSRRHFLQLATGAAALPVVSRVATAQTYPTRPVRLVVPFATGGGQDATARLLAGRLSDILGQQVVVENRGGAGGNIGNQAVAQAPADGYSILFGSPSLAISPHVYTSIGYDPTNDFTPVTLVGATPNMMVVPNSSPARSIREFIDLADHNRGKLTFASSGIGASPHLSGELFKVLARIDIVYVPYRRLGPAFNDLLAGRIDSYFANLSSVLPHVRSGTIRALGVTSVKRASMAPEVPTFAESGVPGFEVSAWSALFLPAKTPTEIVAKLRDDTIVALSEPILKRRFEELGVEIVTSTPAELGVFLKTEIER